MNNNKISFDNEEYFETKFPNYWISKNGILLSTKNKKYKILKPKIDKDGYLEYRLHVNGKNKYCRAHRLVAETFLDNPENKSTVNHIDGNKQNNNIDNLEWATYSENNYHRFKVLNCNKYKRNVTLYKDNEIILENVATKNIRPYIGSYPYIKSIYMNEVLFRYVYIMKPDKKHNNVNAYWNGELLKEFKNAIEASKYFDISITSVYARLNKPSEFLQNLNRYKLVFSQEH